MSDVERLFQQIVQNLTAVDPARLRQPLTVAELRDFIVPYRANRRALQLESSEDYELAVIRLCAGEGGLARLESSEAEADFASELGSPNPDLTVVDRHGKAVITLNPQAIARASHSQPHLAFAPPEIRAAPVEAHKAEKAPASSAVETTLEHCPRCGGILPRGRAVNFCPQCGENLTRVRCPECQTELEPGWRHCVGCGLPVKRVQS
jgi:hypothetical protein